MTFSIKSDKAENTQEITEEKGVSDKPPICLQLFPEALDYSETKKILGLHYPKQTNKQTQS